MTAVGLAMRDLISLSKAVSRVLRHRPDAVGIELDPRGWCRIDALLEGLARAGVMLTREQLDEVVRTSDKARFAISEDRTRIRARQGHSVTGIDVELKETAPPSLLFHGTTSANLIAIGDKGLVPMERHHVHLSACAVTAAAVGSRRGRPVILEVNAGQMHADGHKFWLSENGVWLVRAVPGKYLERRS
jgi:putative RNA 2'-phosphotransferase